MTAAAGADLTLRPAEPAEAETLAELFLAARRAAEPAMPPLVHGPEEVRAWFRAMLAADGPGGERDREVWVAASDAAVIGYLVLDPAWLDSLYVRPGRTGQGIGSILLDLAKALRPSGFELWVFESNVPARTFYARRGLVDLERTDGSGNEEQAPDIKMAWAGRGRGPGS